MTGGALPSPRSGKFLAPGRPVAPARLAQVRGVIVAGLQDLAADHDLALEAGRDPDELLLHQPGFTLGQSCDLAETGLKRLLRGLSADLIGGANVTRLDRVLVHGHPRLPYRRALRIVGGRGWHLNLGAELPPDAAASLVRFCGLLPVQILYLPGQPQPAGRPAGGQGHATIAPWGGQILEATLPAADGPGAAVCRLHLDRLLRFVLGLGEGPAEGTAEGTAAD